MLCPTLKWGWKRERGQNTWECANDRVIREKSHFRDGGRTRIFQLKTHRRSWWTEKTSWFYLYIWLLELVNKDKLQELMTDRFVQACNNHCKTWVHTRQFTKNLVETTDQRHGQGQFQPTFMLWSSDTTGETTPADCSIVSARWDFTETRKIKCDLQRKTRGGWTTSSVGSACVEFFFKPQSHHEL